MVFQVRYHSEPDNTETNGVLGMGMDIAAGESDVSHTFSTGIETDIQMHNTTLHMHTLGKSVEFTVQHPDGSESCLLRHDAYDFNWQRGYDLVEPLDVGPGDIVELTCTWDNPTDQHVSWGDGTGDEMCLAISLITWD